MDPPECSGHSHDHDHGDDLGVSLRQYVDLPAVSCLNEEVPGSGRAILKLHEERLSDTPSLQSPEDDPELLLHIPFTEAVTVQSITVRSGGTTANARTAPPRRIKLFVDRTEGLDFETARELPPTQQLELLPPDHMPDGTIDYPCRPGGRFSNISSLTIYFVDNYDDSDEGSGTAITHVGLKGKGHGVKRQAVETVYESQGMRKDHRVRGDKFGSRSVL